MQVLLNLKQQIPGVIMIEKLHKPPNPIKWLCIVSKSVDPKHGLVASIGEFTFWQFRPSIFFNEDFVSFFVQPERKKTFYNCLICKERSAFPGTCRYLHSESNYFLQRFFREQVDFQLQREDSLTWDFGWRFEEIQLKLILSRKGRWSFFSFDNEEGGRDKVSEKLIS